MAKIDRKRVLDKIEVIQNSLDKLETLSCMSESDFIMDFKNFDSAKYNLQIAIEAMIDAGNHIISRKGYGSPKTYSDVFEILQDNGAIPENDAKTYKLMARFRNRIVHFYDEVDDKEVYSIVQSKMKDFKSFIEHITGFLAV